MVNSGRTILLFLLLLFPPSGEPGFVPGQVSQPPPWPWPCSHSCPSWSLPAPGESPLSEATTSMFTDVRSEVSVSSGESLPPQFSGSLDPSYPFFVSLLRKSSSWGLSCPPPTPKMGWCLFCAEEIFFG